MLQLLRTIVDVVVATPTIEEDVERVCVKLGHTTSHLELASYHRANHNLMLACTYYYMYHPERAKRIVVCYDVTYNDVMHIPKGQTELG